MSLIFFIRAQQYPVELIEWIKFDSKTNREKSSGLLSLSQIHKLKDEYVGCKTVFLIPGELVRCIDVSLPQNNRKFLKSLPYLIEDRLGEAIESLHVAVGNKYNEQFEALAIKHEQMQYWLDLISDCGIEIDILAPDYTFLQRDENVIRIEDNRCIVSTEKIRSSFNKDILWEFVSKFAPLVKLTIEANENISCPPILKNNDRIRFKTPDFTLLRQYAVNYGLQKSNINLLSGNYKRSSLLSSYFNNFKRPIVVMSFLVLLGFIQIVLDNFMMQREIERLDQQMLNLYKDAFPQSQRIPDPVRQMRAKLNHQEMTDTLVFLPWLAEAAPLLEKYRVELTELRFDQDKNSLRLQLTASNFTQLELLSKALQDKGRESELRTLMKNKDNIHVILPRFHRHRHLGDNT